MGIKLRPGRINSQGTGYYFGNDGKRSYGTPSNGYVTEIKEKTYTQPTKSKSTPTPASAPQKTTGADLAATMLGGFLGVLLAEGLFRYGAKILKVVGLLMAVGLGLLVGWATVMTVADPWIQRVGESVEMFTTGAISLSGVLFTVAWVGCICAFVFFTVRTFLKRNLHSIWQLVIAYYVLFIPAALVHMGGFGAFAEHGGEAILAILILPAMFMGRLLTIPCALLFLMWLIPKKIRQKHEAARS